jgi:hypothetical protein
MNKLKQSTLTSREEKAVGFFIKVLETAEGADAAVTFGYLVDNWNKKHFKSKKYQITDIEGKRIIRYIRDTGLIRRLMADHYGYFIAENNSQYNKYLAMLERKIQKLSRTYNALKRQVR